jgi:heme oxygenase (biliverdin-IX-beta and delta-forming)
MLLASAPDDPTGMGIAKSSGLRDMLQEATATAHRDLDAKFAAFDLASRRGYRRFLEASAAALLPLEAALERAGVACLFTDWPQRARRAAITADLARLDGVIRSLEDVCPLSRNGVLGTMYVLEGSRLGAGYLLRMVAQSADPLIAGARAYLGHGAPVSLCDEASSPGWSARR